MTAPYPRRVYFLRSCSQTGLVTAPNPHGMAHVALGKTWEQFLGDDDGGWSIDDLIEIHPYIMALWPFGVWAADGSGPLCGYGSSLLGVPFEHECSMRNPREALESNLVGFVDAWRTRNDAIAAAGGTSSCYTAPPPLDMPDPSRAMAAYYEEITDARFHEIGLDGVPSFLQPVRTPARYAVDYFRERGFRIHLEGLAVVHGQNRVWWDGTNAVSGTIFAANITYNSIGFYNPTCPDIATDWAVTIGGDIPAGDRLAAATLWASRGYGCIIEPSGMTQMQIEDTLAAVLTP